MIALIMAYPFPFPRDHDPQLMITRKDDGEAMIMGILWEG
jgi:hypothetical protein